MSTQKEQPKLPEQPEQTGLDECTAAFCAAAMCVNNTILQGKQLRTREMALRSASGVIWSLLPSMQYPRDQGLLPELARLTQQLTGFLEQIVLNAEPDDERLKALRKLAENAVTWPTLVRPGDKKLTGTIIEKLGVGRKAPVGSLRNANRPPSLVTARNRLALSLLRRIQNRTECILLVTRNAGPARRCSTREARVRLRCIEPGVPKREHLRFLKLLREARDYPFSQENLKRWNRLLSEFALIIDPELKQFSELKQVKSATGGKYIKTEEARLRSEMEKFFNPALKNLLA